MAVLGDPAMGVLPPSQTMWGLAFGRFNSNSCSMGKEDVRSQGGLRWGGTLQA